jgi:two-component system phosphate regulon sensor histidine kinase PhoR
MGTSEATILVVDPDAANAARRAVALAGRGRTEVAGTAARGLQEIAAGRPAMCVLADALTPAELGALAVSARRQGVYCLLGADARGPAALELALRTGCNGVLTPDEPATAVDDHAARAAALAAAHRLDRQDFEALRRRYETLQQRCAQQAESFQESQESYYLDLARVMTIISNIMDGIVFVDRGGNVTLLNPVAEDLLGTKAFVAVGRPLRALQGRADLLGVLVADHDRVGSSREVSQTVEVHHNEQDLLYIKCITSRVADYSGQPAGTLTVLKDVTAEYKTDQLKNQYLSIVAHELRTPLTGIKTFSTMMCKGTLGPLTEKQHRVVDSIREQSLRLEQQIDKLINLGHLEAEEYGQDREEFSVAEFTAGLVLPFEQPARDRQIALTFACEGGDDEGLLADRADLRRACQALIENAVKFTSDGGNVDVRVVRARDGGLRFVVKDSGIGIDPRYHRRIFEKFFQVEDPLTRHHGGAGLGLFVAKGIVEAHGSRIEVSSRLGEGAEFSFALPHRAACAAAAAPAADGQAQR